jgi:ArsR family transcriptional regulator, virulence genes transcriptional regulator
MNDGQMEKILKAMANRRRMKILKILKKRRASVGEIAMEIKLSFKSTSRHLAILHSTDLVEKEQEGLVVYHKIRLSKLKELIQAISSS